MNAVFQFAIAMCLMKKIMDILKLIRNFQTVSNKLFQTTVSNKTILLV